MRCTKFIKLTYIETKLVFKIPDIYLVAFALPLIILLILNSLYSNSDQIIVTSCFSGISSIGIVGAGIMGLSSIVSEYREQGVLRRYFVTPVNPVIYMMAVGISLAILAMVSTAFVHIDFYILLKYKIQCNIFIYILTYLYAMISVFAIGILISSIAQNQRIANVITILIYFPSILLSGCTIPYENLPDKLKIVSDILPTTHAIRIVQNVIENKDISHNVYSIIYITVVIFLCIYISPRVFKWE